MCVLDESTESLASKGPANGIGLVDEDDGVGGREEAESMVDTRRSCLSAVLTSQSRCH